MPGDCLRQWQEVVEGHPVSEINPNDSCLGFRAGLISCGALEACFHEAANGDVFRGQTLPSTTQHLLGIKPVFVDEGFAIQFLEGVVFVHGVQM